MDSEWLDKLNPSGADFRRRIREAQARKIGDRLEIPEPLSPSIETLDRENERLAFELVNVQLQNATLREELILRNQDIEDLRLTNRNLSRKIVEDARKRGEAATQQPNWPRGVHGS